MTNEYGFFLGYGQAHMTWQWKETHTLSISLSYIPLIYALRNVYRISVSWNLNMGHISKYNLVITYKPTNEIST